MGNAVSFLLSLVVILPLLAGLFKYRKMDPAYHPFIWLLALAVLAEVASRICTTYFGSNTVVVGIYSLAESILLLLLFHRWRPATISRRLFWILAVVCCGIWLTENVVYGRITRDFSPVFRVCYSFMLVILSVNEINYLITHQNSNIFRNARFVFCIAFLIYFLYEILLEGALYISANKNAPSISNSIISLLVTINVLTNLIYLVAVLLIPQKSFYNFDEKLISMKTSQKRKDNM